MILFLDIRTAQSALVLVGPRKADRFASAGKGGVFGLLSRADKKSRIFSRPPTAVVVAVGDRGGTASWSAIRTAVALGNSLAYAWNVPVVGLPLAGDEKLAEVEEAVRKAARRPRKGAWLKAAYSGEPNITRAKPVF